MEQDKFEKWLDDNVNYPRFRAYLKGCKKILDIGCGHGKILRGNNVYGIDVSISALKIAKSRQNVALADTCHIPFKNGVFDGVLMSHVLEHVENPENVLKEVCRVLKQNAKLVIAVPNDNGISWKIKRFFKRGKDDVRNFDYGFGMKHLQFFNFTSLCNLVQKVGFKIIKKSFILNFFRELFL